MSLISRGLAAVTSLGLLFGFLAAAPPGAAGMSTDYEAVDRYVQSQVDTNHFPGVSVAMIEGDQLAYARGFGHDAQGQAVTPQTPFMIGSNSKSFTALAVMQLAEAGKVGLDAPVQRYIPGFQLADPGLGRSGRRAPRARARHHLGAHGRGAGASGRASAGCPLNERSGDSRTGLHELPRLKLCRDGAPQGWSRSS